MKAQIEQTLLQQVEKSPQAVSVHDKTAWLELFATQSIIEDPVGSRPHIAGVYDSASGQRGKAQLARFYETFIAPNKIRFDVHQNIVSGSHVMRDLDIHIQMADKVHLKVPMHLLYHLVQQDGEWKITRLAAHWELIPMVMQLMGNGMASLPVSVGLSVRMLKYQGIFGMLAYSKAAFSVGRRGKKRAQSALQAFNLRNRSAFAQAFTDNGTVCIANTNTQRTNAGKQARKEELPDTVNMPAADFTDYFQAEFTAGKWIAAGDSVTASVQIRKGKNHSNSPDRQGVLLFRFNRKSGNITHMRLYG